MIEEHTMKETHVHRALHDIMFEFISKLKLVITAYLFVTVFFASTVAFFHKEKYAVTIVLLR